MKSKFCPQCGRKIDDLIEGLCKTCFSKESPLLLKFKDPKIVICIKCNSYMYKNKWHKPFSEDPIKNLKKIISELLYEKLQFNPEAKINQIKTNTLLPKGFQIKQKIMLIDIELSIKGNIQGKELKESYEFPIKINFSVCNICKKKNSQYYESIIQIRPKSKEILDFIKKNIKFRKDVFITKQESLKFGYNIYITSQKYAKHIASLLKKKFNAEIKVSYTLFGRKEGKDVYRSTISIKLPKPL